MSWADAVVDIAERLEQRAGEWGYSDNLHGPTAQEYLRSTARELRTVVKTAVPTVGAEGVLLPYKDNNRHKEDEFQIKIKEQAHKEESNGELMTEIVGGPWEGDNIMRPAAMPLGTRTEISGFIYELKEDCRLHFVR